MSTATDKVKEMQDLVDKQMLEYWLEVDKEGKFLHPPKDDDELHEFIHIAYKLKIPRKVVTKGHSSPFDFVADLFFERVKNALAFANRNGGKTQDVAVLNHLDMLFKPGCEVASAGAVLDQADKCYRYFLGFMELPWFTEFCERYEKTTGRKFKEKTIRSYTQFGNGSVLEIITATEKGLRSPHPHKARVDEIDIMPWSLLQTGLSMARSTGAIRGQNVFTSTRQHGHGSMQRLLDEASDKGIEVYQWNIWEAVEECTRRCVDDPKFGTCPILTFCQGKAHHCDGFYKIDDFIDKVRILDRETFETEWLNLRPSREKLVYHRFDPIRHVMTPKRLVQMTGLDRPSMHWSRTAGLDFGSSPGHPFVFLNACQLPNGLGWLVFFEYVAEQKLIRDHAARIKSSPFFNSGLEIFSDWDAQDRMELKALGVRTKEASKDVQMGIDCVNEHLAGYPPKEDPHLYIWHECVHTIKEFGLYQWPVGPDGKPYKIEGPKKENDHCMDALRYILFSKKKHSGRKYRARSVPGI